RGGRGGGGAGRVWSTRSCCARCPPTTASSRRWRCCAPPNPEHTQRPMTEEMTRYYARRAGEYERVYEIPAWQPGIAEMRRRVAATFAARDVFHGACGAGYGTGAPPDVAAHA